MICSPPDDLCEMAHEHRPIPPEIKGPGVRIPQHWLCVKAFGKLCVHNASRHPTVKGTRSNKVDSVWTASAADSLHSPKGDDWKSEFQYLLGIYVMSSELTGIPGLHIYTYISLYPEYKYIEIDLFITYCLYWGGVVTIFNIIIYYYILYNADMCCYYFSYYFYFVIIFVSQDVRGLSIHYFINKFSKVFYMF